MLAMAATMESYSEKVLAEVCGYHGIVTKQKFLPTVSELKAALDEAARPEVEEAARLKVRVEAAQIRAEVNRIATERETRPTYEELIATLPPSLRLNKNNHVVPMTRDEFFTKFPHVTSEQLDAVPDAKDFDWKTYRSTLPTLPAPEEKNPFEDL